MKIQNFIQYKKFNYINKVKFEILLMLYWNFFKKLMFKIYDELTLIFGHDNKSLTISVYSFSTAIKSIAKLNNNINSIKKWH